MVFARDTAGRVRDVAAGEPGGRHLVKQRLEGAVDVAIHQGGPGARARQPPHRRQTAEAGADDHDTPGAVAVRGVGFCRPPASPHRCHATSAAARSLLSGLVPALPRGITAKHDHEPVRPWETRRSPGPAAPPVPPPRRSRRPPVPPPRRCLRRPARQRSRQIPNGCRSMARELVRRRDAATTIDPLIYLSTLVSARPPTAAPAAPARNTAVSECFAPKTPFGGPVFR